MRPTDKRLGDVTLVLAGAAALLLAGSVTTALQQGSNPREFWLFIGLSSGAGVLPAFGAACTFGWMDRGRRRQTQVGVAAVLLCVAIAVLGAAMFSPPVGDNRGGQYLAYAANLLMIFGGLTLVLGMPSTQGRTGDDET